MRKNAINTIKSLKTIKKGVKNTRRMVKKGHQIVQGKKSTKKHGQKKTKKKQKKNDQKKTAKRKPKKFDKDVLDKIPFHLKTTLLLF